MLNRLKRLNEELEKLLKESVQELEISETVCYNESDDEEEIVLPPDEYKRAIATLETWLKSNSQFKKQKYLEKGIQSTDENAYAYIFKKVGGIKKYKIIYRQIIL